MNYKERADELRAALARMNETIKQNDAAKAADDLVFLTSTVYDSMRVAVIVAEREFNLKRIEIMNAAKNTTEGRIRTQTCDEYFNYRSMELAYDMLRENINSLKKWIDAHKYEV